MPKTIVLLFSFFVLNLCSCDQESESEVPEKSDPTEKVHPAVTAVITWAEAYAKNGEVKPEEDILDPLTRARMEEGDGGVFLRDFDKTLGGIVLQEKENLVFSVDQTDPQKGEIMVGPKRVFVVKQTEGRWFCDFTGFLQERRGQAMRQTVYYDMESFLAALNKYKNIGGTFPSEKQGLGALFKKPTDDPRPRRWTQSVASEDAFKDPWGNLYQYKLVDGKPVLTSLGPDGKVSDDDLSSDD